MGIQASVMEGSTKHTIKPARPLDITVLMGGPSSEREVSLISGKAVADALERNGHHVERADISPTDTSALDRPGIEVVFIVLHGEFGESGQVQEICEARGLKYTGSCSRTSELAMDKAAAKQIFRRAGLHTPDWVVLEEYHTPAQRAELLKDFAAPVVIKPIDGGSSVDITIARDIQQRDRAVDSLLDKYGRAMVEKFIHGRELTVGIIGHEALPLLEIVPTREFYDFDAKYSDNAGTKYVFDHGLDEKIVRRIQRAAIKAYDALGCRDMSRIDFMLDAKNTPYILEINTIPGFTGHSLLPMAAAKAGISFDELVDRLAAMALRH